MLKERSYQSEIMDDLEVSGPVIDQTLRELDLINRKLGGNKISLSAFQAFLDRQKVNSLADLGCGGADILIAMAEKARAAGVKVAFFGIDANPHIVQYASTHTRDWENISVTCENIFSPEFSKNRYDLIHCCLFLHHFTEEELVNLLKQFRKQAKLGIIINDLHRHWLAWWSIKLLTLLFSRSYMVRNDAALSVARGFRKHELIHILKKAEIENYSLRWKWAFRWELIISD